MQAIKLQGSPLSIQQTHVWSLQKNEQVYRTLCAIQIQGVWDRNRFKKALDHVIARHEILRTVFFPLPGMDIPMQVISHDVPWDYAEINLEHLSNAEQHIKIDQIVVSLQEEPYDLRHGPLVLTRLLYLDAAQRVLVLSIPALCADNYSMKLLVDEILNASVELQPREEALQYADVSAWQDEQLLEEEAVPQRDYWHKIELSSLTATKLPFQQEVRKVEMCTDKLFAPKVVEITIPDLLAQKIEIQAGQSDVAVSAWLLACWNVLLWRLSEETIFSVGVACDGRNYEDLENAMGPYARFVPVEARFEKDRSFSLVLDSVKTSLQEATQRQLYFTWDALHAQEQDHATMQYFPILFEYDAWPALFKAGDLTFKLLKHWSCTEPFALKLSTLQIGKRLQLDLYYDLQWITTEQARSLALLFTTLLEQVTEQPQIWIGSASLLSARERADMFTTFSGSRRTWSEEGLAQLFEIQVQRHPNQLAVISSQEQLTYQQLNARSNQLARVLQRRGVGPNVLVGLCLSRQASMLVGLLGVLKARGAYLPLDLAHPAARLRYQLQESGAVLLLSQEALRTHLPDWPGNTLYLEDLAKEMAESLSEDQEEGSRGDDLAYIIYTSGSTGAPKGVMISQRSVVNYTQALCEQLGVEEGWHYATVSTLAADLGNTAIFGALASGGCVQVLEYEQVTSAEAMADWARVNPIDVLKIVPSHLAALLESTRAHELLPRRVLVLGGEALSERLVKRIRQVGGTCQVYNHYGPTETTIGVLMNSLGEVREKDEGEEERNIALGHPIANIQIYVLDRRMQVLPHGVRGELYIGGAGVAWGYLGRGGLTAERFVPDPYSGEEGARLYRTGDLVMYGEGGQVEFIGRNDRQVKLRGYRVELGEIEAVVRQHTQVRESVVILRNDRKGEPRLVCYVVSRQRVRIAHDQLEAYMRERLPEYMVPIEYVDLQEWPLTPNGKIDLQRLPEPEQVIGHEKRKVTEARSPIEELIMQIWRDLLGEAIGIHDNFFMVGGHSLLATRAMARIRAVLQVDLPVRTVFEAPTVAELAQWVERTLRKDEEVPLLPLAVRKRPDAIPLSFAQQRLWFLDQLEPESTSYLASRALMVKGILNVQALEYSLRELIRRHENLRTTFVVQDGQPVQMIQPTGVYTLPIIDLQGLKQEQKVEEATRLAKQEARRYCDLAQGPLLRTYLLCLEKPEEHMLLLTLHHIITDGWSNEIMVRELATLYQAFEHGLPSPLAPLAVQYADYALWQREWLQGEVLDAQLIYWRKQLAHMPPLELHTDHLRQAGQSYHGATLSLDLPEELSLQLITLSQQADVTLFMLLLTALQVLLMRYTGKTDIGVGTPIANRTQAEVESVIGFFVNTLVLRTDLSGNPTFLHLLQQVREVCLEAYAHQDVPFEKVVEMLQPERDLSRSSLFQVSFQFVHDIATSQLLPGLSIESPEIDGASADYDLRVQVSRLQQKFTCTVFYATDLFEEQTIQRFLEHFQILLQGIVLTPEKSVIMLPLLSEQELYLQRIEWNMTRRDSPQELCVHELFEQQVLRTPEAVALVYGNETCTYAELNRQANQLAYYLRGQGVGPEVLVGLCVERTPAMVIGLLGVLKAGGAYIPLDETYPQARLDFMLTEAKVTLLLTQGHLKERFANSNVRLLLLDEQWESIASESTSNLHSPLAPSNAAYIIYTSGSTGMPKGTVIAHQSLTNYLNWCLTSYDLESSNGAPIHSSLSFDLTVTSLFSPLLSGRAVTLLPESYAVEALSDVLCQDTEFSLVKITPTHLQLLSERLLAHKLLSKVHMLVIGGEQLQSHQLAFWREHSPKTRLINEYGPTEATVGCCVYEVPSHSALSEIVPIGRPIYNTQLYILDQQFQIVPAGVVGELYIGGESLARGYLNHPDLTAERFLPDPFSSEAGARLYKTADLVRYRPDGNLDFLGRTDSQVKIRGYRIELGEIEVVLKQHPLVQNAVAIVREDRAGDLRLVAYIVLDLSQAEASSQGVQTSLTAERIKQWQQLYEETYRQETSQSAQIFNIVGWNSSYTGQLIAVEEMQAWLEDTLALVQSYQPERIWEIGCGTGLLLFPLSSTCIHYYGTDFSASVLQEVRQKLEYLNEERGIKPAVTLWQQQANDFNILPEEQVDTVLINSVIQYFPNVDYLLNVLEGAIHQVAPGGRIIIGDVRSLPLLEAFHTDVQLYRASELLTRQQLWQQVQQQVQQEKELVLDPAFFRSWAQKTGQVSRVEIRLKRGRYQNELTQFRYQVVLHVGEPINMQRDDWQQVEDLNWSEQALTRERLYQKLSSERPNRLRLRQIPNARLDRAAQALQWLKGESGAGTVGEWRTELSTQTYTGVEPEDLWEDAGQLGYYMTINWDQHGSDGCYSVLLQRADSELWDDVEEALFVQSDRYKPVYDWRSYANQPLWGEAERQLVPQIKQYLQERMPDYMVPASLMVLKELPITQNGKVDRKGLPAPEENQHKEQQTQDGRGTPVEELIGTLWSEILGHSRVGAYENFFELGGHSLLVTQLVARIRATLEVEVPVRVVFDNPTITGIARWIEQALRKSEEIEIPSPQAVVYPEEIPLSFAQQRLWFLEQLNPNSTTYLGSGILRFRGMLNSRALERSIQEIVYRHENLRTTFTAGTAQPVQVIHPTSHFVLPRIDLTHLRQEQRTQEALTLAHQESRQPCDLAVGPLFRIYLLSLNLQEHLMILSLHHIITDGWSNDVLVRELSVLYRAYNTGEPSPLNPLPIQYADYALWQRQWLQGEMLQKHIAYWQRQLQGVTPVELPTDAPRTATQSSDGTRYSFELSADLSSELMSFSRREGVTLFMTLLAAFQVLLYRLSGQPDIVVGTDVANRMHVETEGLIGFFINLLALRTNLQEAPGFRGVVQQVRSMVLEAYAHQELPFELVVEHVQAERKEHQTPIVQVLCVMQNTPNTIASLSGIELEAVETEDAVARFDLALFLQEEANSIRGSVVYRTALFKEPTIAAWMHCFEVLLGSIVARPDAAIDNLEIYTDEEKERQTREKVEKRHSKARSLKITKAQEIEIR